MYFHAHFLDSLYRTNFTRTWKQLEFSLFSIFKVNFRYVDKNQKDKYTFWPKNVLLAKAVLMRKSTSKISNFSKITVLDKFHVI